MASNQQAKVLERETKLTLIGIFLGLLVAFTSREHREGNTFGLKPFDLAQLGLATYRTARMITYDLVAEPLRAPFTETEPDAYGTAEDVVPEGTGVRRALGELLSCPICTGTWISAGLVYGLHVAPRLTRVFLAIMSAIGLAELLTYASEAMEWWGKVERKRAKPAE